MVKDGALHLDFDDEVTAATVITRDGEILSDAVRKLLEPAPSARRRPRVSQELLNSLAIFVLAILVGFEVISKVPATLHTPLMSGANSIHGIVLVGRHAHRGRGRQPARATSLAFVAVVFGAMNVVGGYVVTDRMLQMFRKKPTAAKAADRGRIDARAKSRAWSMSRSGSTPSSSSPGWPAPRASCSASTR